jgi:hypothetical protein
LSDGQICGLFASGKGFPTPNVLDCGKTGFRRCHEGKAFPGITAPPFTKGVRENFTREEEHEIA